MVIVVFFLISVALLSGFYPIVAPPKDEIQVAASTMSPAREHTAVVPESAVVNKGVVHQSFDYSCGSAALATILNDQMGENFTERQVIAGLLRYGDKQAIISRRAFSLLDMKRFVETIGYKGIGYTATVDDLKELGRACIIPITLFNYRHFVVFKGIYRGHIFFADPARGATSYAMKEFEAIWYRNAIFVVYPRNGGPELHALQLTEKDLRFIDEDSARAMLFTHDRNRLTDRQWEMEKNFPSEDKARSKHFNSINVIQLPESTQQNQ
jgi:predicted double-glycine peptidase